MPSQSHHPSSNPVQLREDFSITRPEDVGRLVKTSLWSQERNAPLKPQSTKIYLSQSMRTALGATVGQPCPLPGLEHLVVENGRRTSNEGAYSPVIVAEQNMTLVVDTLKNFFFPGTTAETSDTTASQAIRDRINSSSSQTLRQSGHVEMQRRKYSLELRKARREHMDKISISRQLADKLCIANSGSPCVRHSEQLVVTITCDHGGSDIETIRIDDSLGANEIAMGAKHRKMLNLSDNLLYQTIGFDISIYD